MTFFKSTALTVGVMMMAAGGLAHAQQAEQGRAGDGPPSTVSSGAAEAMTPEQRSRAADTQAAVQLTQAYFSMPEMQKLLAQENAPYLDGCADVEVSSLDRLMVLEPFTRDDSGQVQKGSWKVQYTAAGCEQTKDELNLIVVSDLVNERVAPVAMLPGQSMADPQLQHDALLAVFSAAMGAMDEAKTTCGQDPLVVGTTLDSMPEESNMRWQETWQINYCDTVAMVPVAFSPDGEGGTSFKVQGKDIQIK